MQNLEDAALQACASAVRELRLFTSFTINDSVLFERHPDPAFWSSCPPAAAAANAANASDFVHMRVTAALGYNTCTFAHNPHLCKPGTTPPRP